MANLLLTATNWKDAANASPPAEWNGTAYAFTKVDTLTLTATAAAGDTLTGPFTGTNQGQGHQIAINVNGVDAITWVRSNDSFPASIAITLAAGDTVAIVTAADLCGFLPEFTLTPPPLPPPPPNCDELGRTSTANVSGYTRTRIHDTRLMLGEKRCLVANFNGAISASRTIASVRWRNDYGYIAVMADARIQANNRSSAVDITANWIGDAILRCEATLDNGEIYIQSFHIEVNGDPIFMGGNSTSGPTVLNA